MDSQGKGRKRAIHLLLLEPRSTRQDLPVTWELEISRRAPCDASCSLASICSNKSLLWRKSPTHRYGVTPWGVLKAGKWKDLTGQLPARLQRPTCSAMANATPEYLSPFLADIQHHSKLDRFSSGRCFTACNTSVCSSLRAKFPITSCSQPRSHNKSFQHYHRFLPWLFGRRWISHCGHYEAHYIHYV